MRGRFGIELPSGLVAKVVSLAEVPDLPPRYHPIPDLAEKSATFKRINL